MSAAYLGELFGGFMAILAIGAIIAALLWRAKWMQARPTYVVAIVAIMTGLFG